MGELVDRGAHPPVGRLRRVDHDHLALGIAVAAERAGQPLVSQLIAQLTGEALKTPEQVGVAVAGHWRRPRRRQGGGVSAGHRVGLPNVKDAHVAVAHDPQHPLAAVFVLDPAADRAEDANRLLALAHGAAELQPATKPRDVRRAGPLLRNQQRVVQGVKVKRGASLRPARPALAGQQLARGVI